MKKLRRVIGSVADLTSGRNEDQLPPAGDPNPKALSSSRRSVLGPLHETSPQRDSYYSYETQSLDSFSSGVSLGTSQVDPYSKVDKHFTKLHKWAYLGDVNKLKKFIKKVAVDVQDSEGKTGLHHAAAQGHGDALLFLLGSKSNVEMKDNAGMTAFLKAVERNQQHIVQMLLQRRIDMTVTDYQGNSSIHFAAKTGATDLLSVLVECGHECDSPNTLGCTPLHVACTHNQEQVAEALLRHGASANVADKEGVTPLMISAKLGSVPLVEVLIDNGANISPVDATKWTAADYARFTNHNQLHHRLKTLLDKEGGVSLIPQGLLSVSDEGSDQTEGAAGGLIKKPCVDDDDDDEEEEEEEEEPNNSWSDTSDVNSVKEKPKLNLTKFLPSSDESSEDVVLPAVTERLEGAMGPPKPPRLHASSSSLASDKAVMGTSVDVHQKEDSVKDNDSWKLSSEDEKPRVKTLRMFVGNIDSSSELRKYKDSDEDPVTKARVDREDLMLELGLNDMKYEVSDEDFSFNEEKPELPSEGTPTKVVITSRNKMSPDHKQRHSIEAGHTSLSAQQLSLANDYNDSPENKNSMKSASPPLSSVRSGNSKKFFASESPVKSPVKKSPRKHKLRYQKSSVIDSDSDEGGNGNGNASSRQHRRKSSTSKKQELAPLTKQLAVGQDSWDSPKAKNLSNKESSKSSKDSSSQDSLPEYQKIEKLKPSSGNSKTSTPKAEGNSIVGDGVLLPAIRSGGRCGSTLSLATGTLGREGTMQQVEEMWEANPSRRKPKTYSGSSSSSPQNSVSSHRLDESNGKSKSEDFDSVRAVDGTCYNVAGAMKETLNQQKDHGKGKENATDGVNLDMDNGDTGQDVSDDDFGSSGVEDLLASKVKVTSPSSQPVSAAKPRLPPEHNVDEEEQSAQESHQQSISSHDKPLASWKQKSLSSSPREPVDKQSTTDTQVVAGKVSSMVSDADKRTTKSVKESASPLSPCGLEAVGKRAPAPHKGGLGSGLAGGALSEEESAALDCPASAQSLQELEDRISVTSTETEESAHINAGLKDSLLVPLSTMSEASNVGQLHDLVRELRLKLEKEFGCRVDLEARVSALKQQEKRARLLCSQHEQNSHQRQQEISSLISRVKQLEYQGHTEQDSSLLKEHSLLDAQQQCGQLEEQCGALQMHAQQQEQLVNSLMVQLQMKERINLTLQEKLEEFSSQTKYVSMKSCQTEDFLMAITAGESVAAQTDWVALNAGQDRQTQATPSVSESFSQTEPTDSEIRLMHSGSSHEPKVNDVETRTQSTQAEPKNMNMTEHNAASVSDRGTQSERVGMVHASCQNTPKRVFKSSQAQVITRSSFSQTDVAGQDGFDVQKKGVSDASCQTVVSNKHTGIQTVPVNSKTYANAASIMSENNSQVHVFTAVLQNVLQDFSQDIKSLLKSSEASHLSAVEDINRALSNPMGSLASSLTTSLQQQQQQQASESLSQEKLVDVQEGISQLNDTLQKQMEAVKELSSESYRVELQNLHRTVEKVNLDLKSNLDNFTEALYNHASSHYKQKALIASLVEQKHKNGKTLTNISGQLDTGNDNDAERFLDLKQHIAAQLSKIIKAIESSSMSEDSGISGSLTRGVVEKLDSIEKSLSLPGEKGCIPEELSGVQCGMQQLSHDLHSKISALEELITAVSSDSKQDKTALMEHAKSISDSNDHLTTVVKLRLSEANSDLSEAIEENFRIVQDHLLHLQQTVVQRINEVGEHISISEDRKASNLTKQMMEIVSQVSGLHSDLAQLQSSVEKACSTPSAAQVVDQALVSSFQACHQQASESLKFQTDSIIQQLERLQKEIHSSLIQGQNAKEQCEVQLLKEAVKDRESELAAMQAARDQLNHKLNQQRISLITLQSKEEELKVKIDTFQDKVHDLTESLKDKGQEVQREAAKAEAQSKDTVKLRQENFLLSSEHAKLSAALQAEQHQRQKYEGELQGLKETKNVTERRMQEIMSYVQQSSLQRTPPTGRDKDENDTFANSKQELKKLEIEKKRLEESCSEQEDRAYQLEVQLKESKVAMELEKNCKIDLEKKLRKAKESVAKLQRDLGDMRQQQEVVQDIETQQVELEQEIKSREAAMKTLREKLEAVNREKLDLKNNIMQLKEEKLSFDLIKQEKEFTEQMQRKTEEQLHDLQRKISINYVSKASLQALQKELESKYQLELSSKLAELNYLIQEQNKQQESLTKSKHSCEQELKNELNRKCEEVICLNAKLSVLEERGDAWRLRHNRLLALYQQQQQQQAHLNHSSLTTSTKHHDDLALSLQEINKHLQTPLASSAFIGQLTPPVSLQLPPPPGNIDSYHYTHSDVLNRTLHSCLNSSSPSRRSAMDDKPQAKISPLQPSPTHSQVPGLNQSRNDYVDLLKMKYGI